LTHDGFTVQTMVTDGSRIYLSQSRPEGLVLAQVSVLGGESSVIQTEVNNPVVLDIFPDQSQLLVTSQPSTYQDTPLMALPLPAGSPRRLSDVGHAGAWSRDGKLLAYAKGSDLYLGRSDASNSRKLASVEGSAFAIAFSADGRRIRFTVSSPQTNTVALWEVNADGTNLHPLLPRWHTPPNECCGRWSPDGRYYLFQSADATGSDIYALSDSAGIFRNARTPVRLTTGPLFFFTPLPSPDGKRLFVGGIQARSELVRYDRVSKTFQPFFGGISATDLDFSRDGKWISYVSVPDGALWRSRADGTDRLQLTSAPVSANFPHWSPDGTRIAFIAAEAGKPWKIHLVSAQGGLPEELLPETAGEVDPSWSPDGTQIAFGRPANSPDIEIQIADIATRKATTVPGSKGLFSPRWSPDGRYLAALTYGLQKLMLYDFRTRAWSEWLTDPNNADYPAWSSDGKYIYYDNVNTTDPKCRRVKLGQHTPEDLFSLRSLRRYTIGGWGSWSGMTADNSRLFVRDVSSQEVYALDVALP
ncbi:MAG TPA: hypothetical protein VFA67_07440, partial [Candidatus Sulfotelmatobacter sp.]|nr:hypothetical protein [Candidatus Sulfotelmatobacter sp.]